MSASKEYFSICGSFVCYPVSSELKFASYYADHTVLQRGPKKAVVWGHASQVGDQVTVSVSGQPGVKTTVVKEPNGCRGIWEVKLPAISKERPYTVTAKSSEGQITLTDVLFGDVWVCSGQSNMGFSMSKIINSSFEITKALMFKNIRIFRTEKVESSTAFEDLKNITTQWTGPTQEAPKGKSSLWNSMIHPLVKMTITGAIWFQDIRHMIVLCVLNAKSVDVNQMTLHQLHTSDLESVSCQLSIGEGGNPRYYGCQFPAMIQDWRNKFNTGSKEETKQDFPFGFVQLAANTQPDKIGIFAGVRWAQTAGFGFVPNSKMPNTYMAVAMDLPDFNSPYHPVHSRYKQDVAARLVLGTRAIAYKEQVTFQGPFQQSFLLNDVAKTVNINYGKSNTIKVLNNNGFEVCCSNKSMTDCADTDDWVTALMTAHDTTSVTVSVSNCGSMSPVGLRYEWRVSPCGFKDCAIYGENTNLPAPAYITTRGFGGKGFPIIG